jgi:hypothetical protein
LAFLERWLTAEFHKFPFGRVAIQLSGNDTVKAMTISAFRKPDLRMYLLCGPVADVGRELARAAKETTTTMVLPNAPTTLAREGIGMRARVCLYANSKIDFGDHSYRLHLHGHG